VAYLHRPALIILACALSLAQSTITAGAQVVEHLDPAPVAHSFIELQGRIQSGATVFVTDLAGHEVKGTFRGLSDTSLDVLVHGQRLAFSQADVRLIKRRQPDPLWNGVLIGVAAGAAPAIYWLFADPNECGGRICLTDLAIGVIPGAAVGLAVDAAIRERVVVYRNPPRSSTGFTFTVAPMVSERRKGVEIILSF
jgi:hypothetical protein